MKALKRPARKGRRGGGGMTLADVARLAGVSPITVSRAINTPQQLTADTLQKVQAAVARTGYVPNRLAGGLASNRSRLVFAIVPTVASPVFLETVQALTSSLEEAGYEVVLAQAGYDGRREEELLDVIIGRRPDGVIHVGIMRSKQSHRRLAAAGIPVVETWDLTPTPIDMLVGFSHEKAGAAVAEFLYHRGVRRPAIISADDYRAGLRRQGFTEAMARLLGKGSPMPCRLVTAPTTLASGRIGLAPLLDRHPDIDAVFCSSDVIAQGALTEALARGVSVPSQLRVMGFGDLDFAAHMHPSLSTVRVDGTAIGRQAAAFIVQRARGEPIAQRIVDLGFTVVERAST